MQGLASGKLLAAVKLGRGQFCGGGMLARGLLRAGREIRIRTARGSRHGQQIGGICVAVLVAQSARLPAALRRVVQPLIARVTLDYNLIAAGARADLRLIAG